MILINTLSAFLSPDFLTKTRNFFSESFFRQDNNKTGCTSVLLLKRTFLCHFLESWDDFAHRMEFRTLFPLLLSIQWRIGIGNTMSCRDNNHRYALEHTHSIRPLLLPPFSVAARARSPLSVCEKWYSRNRTDTLLYSVLLLILLPPCTDRHTLNRIEFLLFNSPIRSLWGNQLN